MSTSYTPPNLEPGEWKWCVKAGDAAGNWSAWSDSRKVDISPKIPAAPALVLPATAGFTNNTKPLLKWKSVPYGLYYQVQISSGSTFLSTVEDQTITDQEFTTYMTDLAEGKYYWRVRAKNSDDAAGPWSSAWNFTVDRLAPPIPVLKTPLDGAPSIGTPTFSWNASVGAKYYRLGYTTGNCADLVEDTLPKLTTTSYKPAMQEVGDLHWCVRAGDAAGNWSDWSGARTAHIDPMVPTAPALVLPATAGYTNSSTPTLKWKAVAYGDKYQVQVSSSSTFLTTVEDYSGPGTEFSTYTTSLVVVKYYWRVRAYNINNKPGSWSPVWNFTVDTNPPAAPGMLTPSDGSSVNTTIPKLTISPVLGAKYYQFQVDPAGSFASPKVDVTLTTTSYTIPTAKSLDFGTNYWRVQSIDAAGNPSGWTSPRTFNINIQKTPSNGLITTSKKPVFTWTAVPGAIRYRIQANKDTESFLPTEGLEINITTATATTSYTPSVDMDYGLYYWQIQVQTASGWSSWTSPYSFTINHP
jgi:large repetitive protein